MTAKGTSRQGGGGGNVALLDAILLQQNMRSLLERFHGFTNSSPMI
jgi:hypothetical protein